MQARNPLAIPKEGFGIWLGFDPARDRYLDNLLDWAKNNQDDGFQFILYMDSEIADETVSQYYVDYFSAADLSVEDQTKTSAVNTSCIIIIRDIKKDGFSHPLL